MPHRKTRAGRGSTELAEVPCYEAVELVRASPAVGRAIGGRRVRWARTGRRSGGVLSVAGFGRRLRVRCGVLQDDDDVYRLVGGAVIGRLVRRAGRRRLGGLP